MFVTDRVLDIIVKTKDESYALALSAFNSSHELAIAAKENEIRYLKSTLEDTRSALAHANAKADALMDRLLVRDAKVAAVAAAVSPSNLAAAAVKDENAAEKLRVIFDSINEMGDMPVPKENRAFEFAGGGSAVSHV